MCIRDRLDTVHQQQLQADQNNQTTLSQASSAKLDRQRLDQIIQVLTEIKSGLANSDLTLPTVQSYRTQIDQVEGQLRQQIRETDNQITQGLQPVSYTHLDVYKRQEWLLPVRPRTKK